MPLRPASKEAEEGSAGRRLHSDGVVNDIFEEWRHDAGEFINAGEDPEQRPRPGGLGMELGENGDDPRRIAVGARGLV